jgi:hypothetical protein
LKNLTEIYSWGFGMNYVLLNGEENEEYEPFKVRNKIINDEIIEEIQADGQHVLYTAYEKTENKVKPNIGLDKWVTTLMGVEKNRLQNLDDHEIFRHRHLNCINLLNLLVNPLLFLIKNSLEKLLSF